MKLRCVVLIILLFLPVSGVADDTEQMTPEQEKYITWAKGIYESLDRQTGEIKLPNGVATLNVPDDFYYLNPADSDKVLVDVWKNPPGDKLLGMLMPSNVTPFSEQAWAVTINYQEDGYVSDDEADKIDYDELLSQMKNEAREASKEREKQGYGSIELVGWAAQPYYDKESNKLHWAKEINFNGQEFNTLNYNIRVLGRKGVLVLNFIAGMEQKEMIESRLSSVLSIAEFDQGMRYADFDPNIDKVAVYGIGALVAGKVIAKTGLFAAGLILLKKFGVIFVIFMKKFGIFLVVGVVVLFKKVFSKKEVEQE